MLGREGRWPTGVPIAEVSCGFLSSVGRFRRAGGCKQAQQQQVPVRRLREQAWAAGGAALGSPEHQLSYQLLSILRGFCSVFTDTGNSCVGLSGGRNNSSLLLKACSWLMSFHRKCGRILYCNPCSSMLLLKEGWLCVLENTQQILLRNT